VEPGNLIPEQLYRVVAELLAFAGRWDRLHRTEGNR
jgi:type III secretion system FlhB-like substrate exporter